MPRDLVVSIINYRTGPLTIDCAKSVLADIGDIDAEVVIVDNASADGSADLIADWIATGPGPVRLIRSPENTGFSGGHNQSFAAVPADHYLILNSDAELRPGFLATILAAARTAPEAGLFAPRLEWDDGTVQTSCFRFHSPMSEFERGACSAPVSRLLRRRIVSLGTTPDPDAIQWASFACILVRGRVIADIGPMDEGYFLYFEDSEFCLRAARAGWRIAHVPEARAVHHRGGSGPVKALVRTRKRLPTYYWRSRSRFLAQAHGRAGLWLANLAWHAGRVLARVRPLLGKPVPDIIESEGRDIWIGAANPLLPYRPPGNAP